MDTTGEAKNSNLFNLDDETIIRIASQCPDQVLQDYLGCRDRPAILDSIYRDFKNKPVAGLGDLDALHKLPPELLSMVFQVLDLRSIFTFRRINRASGIIVSRDRRYTDIAQYAPRALQAAIATGIGRYITLGDFYRVLCTMNCFVCGQFGGFISLLAVERCCGKCIDYEPKLSVAIVGHISNLSGLSYPKLLQLLPTIRNARSRQSPYKSYYLVSANSAMETLRNKGILGETRLPRIRSSTQRLAFTPMTYLDNNSRKTHDGFVCGGCGLPNRVWEDKNTIRSREMFLIHVNKCYSAIQLLGQESTRRRVREFLLN